MNEQIIIKKIKSRNLSEILFHKDIVNGIKRFSTDDDFPFHIAIHEINVINNQIEYVKPHKHDYPEINIILGNDMEVDLNVEGNLYKLSSNDIVWIPPKTNHSVKAINGKGLFICIIANNEYKAFS